MKQKLSIAAALAVTLVLTAGVPVSAADGKITSFHGYEWGTSLEDIQEKEVYSGRYFDYLNLDDGGSGITEDERKAIINEDEDSDDEDNGKQESNSTDIFASDLVVFMMAELMQDVSEEEKPDFSLFDLCVMIGSVAGNKASVNYLFADDVLDAGVYGFIFESPFEEREIIRKYNEVYGDPLVLRDGFKLEPSADSPPESLYAWNDSSGNVILAYIYHDQENSLTLSPEFDVLDYARYNDAVVYFNGNGEIWHFLCSKFSTLDAIENMWNFDWI